MKILFQNIKYKNLLSSGNAWTKVELDKNRTTLISGSNPRACWSRPVHPSALSQSFLVGLGPLGARRQARFWL